MDFLRKHKKVFISALVGVCLLAMLLTAGDRYAPSFMEKTLGFVITPVQSAFTAAGDWFGKQINFFVHMGELSTDNERLKMQNEIYSAEISRLTLVDKENERLSELLNTDRRYAEYPTVGARIIAKDVSNWYRTFTIDLGSSDGLAKNMVVLASGGLCGRISEVWYNSATVVALIDDSFSVSAESGRTGDTGIVRGDVSLQLEGKCRMDFIDMSAEIVEGDEIVTSQISSIYPPGITIGTVLEIKSNTNGTQSAIIQLTVDFANMSHVMVITELFEHNMQKTSEILQDTAKRYPELTMENADVIARRSEINSGFVMNRGERHDVSVGQAVLAAGGLAGLVTETGHDYAVVTSFLDSALPIGVQLKETGVLGLLRRDEVLMADGLCYFEVLTPGAQVEIDDEVVISGAGDRQYPAGVTVGYISEIRPMTDGGQRFVVRAAVDFRHAASVLVVVPDAAEPAAE